MSTAILAMSHTHLIWFHILYIFATITIILAVQRNRLIAINGLILMRGSGGAIISVCITTVCVLN